MPKQKTHKGLAKRVKVTARGKIKAKKSGKGHLLSVKNAKSRRNMSQSLVLTGVFADTMKKMLGSNK